MTQGMKREEVVNRPHCALDSRLIFKMTFHTGIYYATVFWSEACTVLECAVPVGLSTSRD